MTVSTHIHESWFELLGYLFDSDAMKQVEREVLSRTISPLKEVVFKAFRLSPNRIKVVIMGQDPYPNPLHATGMAFGVGDYISEERLPLSLKVIMNQLEADYLHFDTSLEHWEEQGVFLINAALTCDAFKIGSHYDVWDGFTAKLVQTLSAQTDQIVWVFWGKKAQSFEQHLTTNSKVIKSSHPAAEKHGIVFDGKFDEINKTLESLGELPINWLKSPYDDLPF